MHILNEFVCFLLFICLMLVSFLGQSQNLRGQRKFSSPAQTSHQFHVLSLETLPATPAPACTGCRLGPDHSCHPRISYHCRHRGFHSNLFLGLLPYCAEAGSPQKNKSTYSGWCGSVRFSLACKLKGHQFDSRSEHTPGFQDRSPVGGVREVTIHFLS